MSFIRGLIAATVAVHTAFSASAQECDTGTANTDAMMSQPPAKWDADKVASMSPDNIEVLSLYLAGSYADTLKREAGNIFDSITDASVNGRDIDPLWYTRDGGYSPVFEPVLEKLKAEIETNGAEAAIEAGRSEAITAVDTHVAEQITNLRDLNDPSICNPAAPKAVPGVKL